jgi:hypothetical protein
MLLALALADHAADDGGRVWPSVALLAEKTRQSPRTVQYQLRRMEAVGWLQTVSAGNGGRSMATEYRINPAWIAGAAFDDLAPPQNEPSDIETGAVLDQTGGVKGCNPAHKRVQSSAQKGAIQRTKGCNPRQERVQPVAPASNHHRTIKNHQGTAHALNRASPPAKKIPDCPVQKIVDAYHDQLPTLPRVVVVGSQRKKAIGRFWAWVMTSKKSDGTPRATTADEGLAWVQAYFGRAAKNDFVTGKSPRGRGHEGWEANIDYLVQENAIALVIERTKEAA